MIEDPISFLTNNVNFACQKFQKKGANFSTSSFDKVVYLAKTTIIMTDPNDRILVYPIFPKFVMSRTH